jgi:histidinol-phosphate aminotransferase
LFGSSQHNKTEAQMRATRRSFIGSLGVGGASLLSTALVGSRGSEARAGSGPQALAPGKGPIVRLDSNENPLGPGTKVLEAMRAAFGESSRYPHRAGNSLADAIARFHGIPTDHVLVTCGSGELLRMAVHAFASSSRPLVTALPTFEVCTRTASFLEHGLYEVRVDPSLSLDLRRMGELTGINQPGLVFLCNPNNPTGTVHREGRIKDFVRGAMRASPATVVLLDEAYHEYVEDEKYSTAIPLALEHPQVLVCRTFSKVYGLAGMRIGYAVARPETLKRLEGWRLGNGVNILGMRAALAARVDGEHVG